MESSEDADLAYAGFFSRLVAFVVDLVVLSAAIGASAWVVHNVERLFWPVATVELEPVLRWVVPVAVVAYFVGLWAAFGQTVGKSLLGLRVVTVDGGRVGLGRAALRLLGYLISALPAYTGFLWVLVDSRHRGWHDFIAGTAVVYAPSTAASRAGELPLTPARR